MSSSDDFRNAFFEKKNFKEFHYQLLNILNLIIHQDYLVCFCDKYKGPWLFGQKCLCPVSRILREFSDFEKYCDRYQFDECKFPCYAIRHFEFLNEYFVVDKESLL